MKKILLILMVFTSLATYAQAEFPESVQLTNQTSTTATKVNVQESNGVVNTIAKSDLIEVLEYASAINLPVTGVLGKIYVTIDNGRLYRWNGTVYTEISSSQDISGKENIANKQNSLAVDGTGVKYPTVDAVNTLKAIKSNEALSLAQRKGDVLYGILDQYTGEEVTLSKVTGAPTVDNVIYFQLGSEYFKRNFTYIKPEWFGAVGDRVTDDTASVQAALNSMTTSGGELRFSAKKYLISGQLTVPHDGSFVAPKMASIILSGSGAGHTGRGTAPVGGTILDMRFSGTYGKIIGLGLGLLKIKDISFIDGGSDSTPFIYGTNPTMHISGCSFLGTKVGVLADQDAIVLGGTLDVESFGGIDDGFQGYGSVIENNYFGRIRRAVWGRMFFNGNVIQNNTIWNTCGSNIALAGAIELDGDPANTSMQKAVGNVITGNLIEATGYQWCIVLRESEQNTITGNNFYDESASTIGYIYCVPTSAVFNTIVAGFNSDLKLFVNAAAYVDNTVINNHSAQFSSYSESQIFKKYLIVQAEAGAGNSDKLRLKGVAGSEVFDRIYRENEVVKVMSDNAGNETEVALFKNFGGGILRETWKGTDVRLESEGTFRIRSGGAGSELYLGDSASFVYIINGVLYSNRPNGIAPLNVVSKTPVANLTVQRIDNGSLITNSDTATDGAKIFSGNTTPESNLTALVGSLYLRTDGSKGSTFYVKESGTASSGWSAVPSTDSPNLTGVPTAPTAQAGTNTSQLATTAFVLANTNANAVPTQLKDFYVDVNNVGLTETDLLTYTTPANRLNAAGEKIISVYAGTMNDVTASSQLKAYFAGTLIADTGALTMSVTGAWVINASIIRTGATTARSIVNISTPGASTASYTKYTSLTGLTFTNTNIIKVTGTAAGATGGDNDITATYGNILWQPAAL